MSSQDKEWRTDMEEKYQGSQGTRDIIRTDTVKEDSAGRIDLEISEDIVDKSLMVDKIDSVGKGR